MEFQRWRKPESARLSKSARKPLFAEWRLRLWRAILISGCQVSEKEAKVCGNFISFWHSFTEPVFQSTGQKEDRELAPAAFRSRRIRGSTRFTGSRERICIFLRQDPIS